MSRISVSSSRIARSVSSRWACSASTCSRASSYSRSASGLTGPIWARRRSRRSSRRSISARSSSLSACLGRRHLLAEPLGDRRQLALGLGPAVAEVGGLDLGLGQLVGGRLHLAPAARTPAASRRAAPRRSRRRRPRRRPPCPRSARPGRGSRRRPPRPRPAPRGRRRAAPRRRRPAGAAPRGGARRAGPRRGGRGGRRARRRPGRRPAPPRGRPRQRSSERATARPSTAAPQPGVDLAQLLLQLARPLGRGAAGADVEGQRPELGPQALQPRLELGLAAGEAGGADRDPLLLAAQLGQQAPGLGALAVAGGEALLGLAAALADLGQPLLELGPGRARLRRRLRRRGGAVGAEAQLLGDEPAAQAELLALDPRAQLGRLRLALQRPQPGPRLALDVERAVEVVAGGAQLQLGPAAAFAVLAEPGGLLDQQPALARLGVDDRLDPALADHRVHLAAEVGVGEDVDDVGEPAAGAVEPVAAVAAAVEPALRPRSRRTRSRRGRRSCRSRPRPRRRGAGRSPCRRRRSRPASRRRGSPPGSARRAPRGRRR